MNQHVTSAQVRAARSIAKWSVRDLAERSGVHRNTISNFENGHSGGDVSTIERIRTTLEGVGISFIAHGVVYDPKLYAIYDPTSGSGGFLVKAHELLSDESDGQ